MLIQKTIQVSRKKNAHNSKRSQVRFVFCEELAWNLVGYWLGGEGQAVCYDLQICPQLLQSACVTRERCKELSNMLL